MRECRASARPSLPRAGWGCRAEPEQPLTSERGGATGRLLPRPEGWVGGQAGVFAGTAASPDGRLSAAPVSPRRRESSAAGRPAAPGGGGAALRFAHACQARHEGGAGRARNAGETTNSLALKREKRQGS